VSEWYQWFIIDKGKSDGLYEELPIEVVNKDGELYAVGRIYEVYAHSSKVALITNPLSGVPVEIKGKNINCFAEGMNSGLLKITYIPFDADVAVGDEIIASNLSSVFAPGTLIGVIKDVSKEPSVDFKTANAEPYFLDETLNTIVVLMLEKEIN
jgi:rod shape-determining protein MreC